MTAIATKSPTIKETLEERAESFANLLPKNYPVDRLITGALVAMQTNPALAKCTRASLIVALSRVAQAGLDVGDTAHLVPFGDTATFVADYRGLIKLMVEAGARKVEAREVRAEDEFSYRYGADPLLTHVPGPNRKAPIVAAYAVVWLRGGVTQFEVMTAEEIDAIRRSKSKQWKEGPLEAWYGRKCVIRRLAKYVSKSPRLAVALSSDGDVIDEETGEVLNVPADTVSLPPFQETAAAEIE